MEERENEIKQAFICFKNKMSEIKKRQLFLFNKVDNIVTEEKSQKLRETIKNLQ